MYHFRIWFGNSISSLLSAAISLNRRRRATRAGATVAQLLPAAVKWNSNCPCPFLLNSQYNLFSRCPAQGVSAAQNTKMWCSISAKNISAFLNVEYDSAILFIFWNWKTLYNLQRRIEKYLLQQQKHLPELHNGAQWIGKNQWFLYDIMTLTSNFYTMMIFDVVHKEATMQFCIEQV